MRIFLDQIGCRLNYGEMETLAGRLQAAGHQILKDADKAQVIVFNSCAVTADAVRGSRKQVRHLHKTNPHARIAVTGCWATLQPQEALTLPGVALVANNDRKDLLHTLLEPWSADFDNPDDLLRLQPTSTPFGAETDDPARRSRTRAFIKVQDGCNNKCTFCIVTIARGASRSRPHAAIVAEIQQLVADGLQEVVLTGVHLGSYGRDLTGDERTDLKALVAAILTETAITRLRLSSLEPWELADGFFDLWQQWPGRLCPHLHLPLQAGTDKQLRQMARRCTTASFRQLVQEAHQTIPDLIITTDLIVGFPGESAVDFQQGLAFVEEMRFAHAHIFPFSAREGTAAAKFAGQLPTAVKKERGQQMRAIVEQTSRQERQRFIGTTRPVLWEGEGQPLTDQPGRLWSGLTDNYLRVTTVVDKAIDLHNIMKPTHLTVLDHESLHGVVNKAADEGVKVQLL